MKSKYFFEEFKKDIEEENTKYEAKSYKQELNTNRCKHTETRIEDDKLICVCGAVWSGARIEDLQNLFKNAIK